MRRSRYLACGAFPLLVAACSSASSGGGAGSADAGSDGIVHHEAGADAAAYDASAGDAPYGQDAGSDAQDGAAPACDLPVVLAADPVCNGCVEQYCDPVWCTCAGDTANVDDAGASGCERYVACVADCVLTDAGLPTTCSQTLCAHAPYSSQEQQDGQKLLDCVVLHCSMQCPQQ
jgi:hypothetical protein